MSLSEQTARVAGGGKSALKTILQKLGVAVGDESIDQYAALAAGISRKLLPDKLVSANTAQQYGKDSSAVVDDILYVLRESVIRRNGVLQTILGTELKFLSVETGTYTGTGTYGSNNPTKITFSKIKPIIWGVICSSTGTSTRSTYAIPNIISWGSGEVPNFSLFDSSTDVAEVIITYSEKTVSFYARGGASYQLNTSGTVYTYYGIGMEA